MKTNTRRILNHSLTLAACCLCLLTLSGPPASAAWPTLPTTGIWQFWGMDPTCPVLCQTPYWASAALSETDIWAVGEMGLIVHWQGSAWEVVPGPTRQTLRTIDMLSPTDGWAGGDQVLLHWDGSAWRVAAQPTGTVQKVKMLSASVGLAATSDGLLRWDGQQWTSSDICPVIPYTLDALAWDNIWITDRQRLYHWDGQSCAQVDTVYVLDQINTISARSGSDVWAGGFFYSTSQSYYPAAIHWDGSSWTWQSLSTPDWDSLQSLQILSDVEGWATTNLSLFSWDGSAWTKVVSEDAPHRPRAVAMFPGGKGWAFGQEGRIWQRSNGVCTPPNVPVLPQPSSIALTGPNDGMYLGQSQTYHWNGVDWQPAPVPGGSWYQLDLRTGADGWMVGSVDTNGAIAHWDGSQWTLVESQLPKELFAVTALPDGYAWASGDGGLVLHWDGQQWTAVDSPFAAGGLKIYGLDFLSDTDGWAAAWLWNDSNPILLLAHWDGAAWTSYPISDLPYWNGGISIKMLSSNDVWVTTDQLLHWDGQAWSKVALNKDYRDHLNSIAFSTPTNGWLVSNWGLSWHWNGESWQEVDLGVKGLDLWAGQVVMEPSGTGWLFSQSPIYTQTIIRRWLPLPYPVFLPNLMKP